MTDIVALARRHKHIASHYEGCEADHIGCLVNKLADEVERQRAENERLRADRRERIATAALQGLMSNPSTCASLEECIVAATVYADALIAKLDEEPQP